MAPSAFSRGIDATDRRYVSLRQQEARVGWRSSQISPGLRVKCRYLEQMPPEDAMVEDLSPDELAWIASAPEEELLGAAGGLLLGEGHGFGGRDDEQSRSFARDWLESRLDQLRPVLCADEVFRDLGGDLTNDILTLLPLLATQLDGNSLLAAIVAGIVLRRGLARFCGTA